LCSLVGTNKGLGIIFLFSLFGSSGRIYRCQLTTNTGLFKMIVRVLTTCHTQYTWHSSICIFNLIEQHSKFSLHTVQVFYMWFYKHQHDNQFRPKLFVACQRWWFEWQFWFVPSLPGYLREKEEHKPDHWRNPIERNHMGLYLECIVFDPDNHFE